MSCLVYPYEDCLYPIVERYNEINSGNKIEYFVVPNSWINSINSPYKSISSNFYETLTKVDCVIFLKLTNIKYMYNDIVEKIHESIISKKRVICLIDLNENDYMEINELANKMNVNITYNITEHPKEVFHYYDNLDCIVVGVGTTIGLLDDISIITQLEKRFSNIGYRVAVVTTNPNACLLGYDLLPVTSIEENRNWGEIVKKINVYINNLQFKRQADIILLQIPGSMINYSNIAIDDFSLQAYAISKAVNIDYFILDSFIDEDIKEYINELNDVFLYRFGFNIDVMVVDNCILDFSNLFENEELQFSLVNDTYANEYINNLKNIDGGIIFTNKNDKCGYDIILKDCVKKLASIEE